jgi:hypothetical protein
MTWSQGVPLEDVEEWPEEYVRKLKENWISTVEQVVAVSATPGGLRTLTRSLDVSEEEMRGLLAVARAHLSPEVAAQLEQPADVEQYGRGARRPRSADSES